MGLFGSYPFTLLGGIYGLGAVAIDRLAGGDGYISMNWGGFDFVTSFSQPGAISLGFSRIYQYDGAGPGSLVSSSYGNPWDIDLGEHELYHSVYQWQKYGIFFGISRLVNPKEWEDAADRYARW